LSETNFQDPPSTLDLRSSTMGAEVASSKSSAAVTDDKKTSQLEEPMSAPPPTPAAKPYRECASCAGDIVVWDLHKFDACNHNAELCDECLTAWVDQ